MVTFTRAITVASGVFAPGHLGELTRVIPFDLVDAVLSETGGVERRLRSLPSRVGVYLVLAMGLFGGVGLAGVWSQLVAGLGGLEVPAPSEKALRDLRRRIGPAPLKALFEVLAGPLAQPYTPGARYRCWRTVAFDGCCSTKVADTEANRAVFGPFKTRHGERGYPMLMLMTLAETGTRALLGAVFGPIATGEIAWARQLLGLLTPGMLLLDDRGFDADEFLAEIKATGAQFLVRARASRRPPVLAVLPDGSYLTLIGTLRLRAIDAQITVTGQDGTVVTGTYRLLTTLLNAHTDPAPTLITLYRERWEIESAYYALRHTLLGGRVLRSKDPTGIDQEMWGILTVYQALRTMMVAACETRPGTDPDRASFTLALHAARHSVTTATGITDDPEHPTEHITRAILTSLLPPRRPRYSARKLKAPGTRYSINNDPQRPRTSTHVTHTHTTIHPPGPPTNPARTTTTPPTKHEILNVLHQRPNHPHTLREIAGALGLYGRTHVNRLTTRLSAWARQGLLTKTAPGIYMITTQHPLTHPPKP